MITAVTTCMGRLEHLEMTLPLMLEEFDHVIVVDWSCPNHSGEWAAKQGAQVVRKSGETYWSAPKARNMGARHVLSRSICFIDADCLVTPGVKHEIESQLNLSSMIIASRTSGNLDISTLGGFLAVDIGHFWGVKGYNETLNGYGLEDCFLRAQLCLERGLKVKRISPGGLGSIRHDNELRGRYFKEPIEVAGARNRGLLMSYLQKHGISDWTSDPRTADVAHRGS